MLKKSNKITLIIFCTLLIITLIVVLTRNVNTTLKKDLRDFAVKDTAAIDKIFLADKAGATILLERESSGSWTLNKKYKPRPDAIQTLLTTINRVSVKSPLAKSAFSNIVKRLASNSVKVEIYQKGKLSKTYYVGGPTPDNTGTYMMLENSATPFVTEIPGFEGYLSTRYFTNESEWRDRTIFALTPPQIKSIRIEYHERPENSFELSRKEDNSFELLSISNKKKIVYDSLSLKRFLALFQHISFEALVTSLSKQRQDSIIQSPPFVSMKVTTVKGETISFKSFHRRAKPEQTDEFGKPLLYDVDRLYAFVDNTYLCLIQFFVFDPIFRPISFFEKDKSLVKK